MEIVNQAGERPDRKFPPYIRSRESDAKMGWGRVFSLLPVLAAAFFCFRIYAVNLIAVTVLSCVLSEALVSLMLGRPSSILKGDTVFCGLLLGLYLPPSVPLWMGALGAIFSTVVVREFFGGYAQYVFNPVAAAQVFLTTGFPITMNQFIHPLSFEEVVPPLVFAKRDFSALSNLPQLILDNHAGWAGSVSVFALLVSGLLLIWQRLIYAEVPLIFLGALSAVCLLARMPVGVHVLTGGAIFVSLFLITDPVTTPHTREGARASALLCGLLVGLVRKFGVYADGTAITILFMNAFTPWIDQLMRPRHAVSLPPKETAG